MLMSEDTDRLNEALKKTGMMTPSREEALAAVTPPGEPLGGPEAFVRRRELAQEVETIHETIGRYIASQIRPLRERLSERIQGLEGVVSSHSRRVDEFRKLLEAAQFSWTKVSERLFEELAASDSKHVQLVSESKLSLLQRIEHEANRSTERLDGHVERMNAIQERLGRLEGRISPVNVPLPSGQVASIRPVDFVVKSGWQQTAEMQAIELEAKDGLINDYKRKLMDCENERQEAIAEIHVQRKSVAEVTIDKRELSRKLQDIIDEKDRIIDDLKAEIRAKTILLKCSECDTQLVFAASTGIQIEPHACQGRAQRQLVPEWENEMDPDD